MFNCSLFSPLSFFLALLGGRKNVHNLAKGKYMACNSVDSVPPKTAACMSLSCDITKSKNVARSSLCPIHFSNSIVSFFIKKSFCVCLHGRDFAYVARDRVTRRHMCHVFRCDTPARTIANTLRDICKKIMIERNLQHGFSKAPESGNGIAIDFLSLSLYIFGILLSDGIVSPIRHSILRQDPIWRPHQ